MEWAGESLSGPRLAGLRAIEGPMAHKGDQVLHTLRHGHWLRMKVCFQGMAWHMEGEFGMAVNLRAASCCVI